MRKRNLALIGVALLLTLVVWMIRRGEETDSRPIPVPMAAGLPPQEQLPLIPSPTESPRAPSPTAAIVSPPDEEALRELDKVVLMLRDYRSVAGENPVGTNAEIMAAVMGDNRRQAKLGPPEGMTLNDNGELIDRWGTPYFFHQLARNQMEVRSAGPDKVMWTDDDPVQR